MASTEERGGINPQSSDQTYMPSIIQTVEDPRYLPPTPSWLRSRKKSRVSSLQLVSYWVISPILEPGTEAKHYNLISVPFVILRFIIACPLLCILLAGFETTNCESYSPNIPDFEARNSTPSTHAPDYDVLYGYSDSIQLAQPSSDLVRLNDIAPSSTTTQTQSQDDVTTCQPRETSDIISPLIRPRYLCYVIDFENRKFETVKVSEFIEKHGDDVDLEFVFVSYTRVQFRVATDEEIDNYTYASEEERDANRQLAHSDRQKLVDWGIDAARRAGKKSFWLDFECIRNQDGVARATSSSDDVYHICDIVRAAHSMIIAIGPSTGEKISSILQGKDLEELTCKNVTYSLQEWGSRLWTLPELLLCPNEHRIQLYTVGDASEPIRMAKRNFAERAWRDAIAVKELVDHFEGSAVLTTTQLMEAAFECFSRRQTDQFSQGDITYAIMGLFAGRHRPSVEKGDSGLQAFAKLAWKNSCGEFLDRIICLDPPSGGSWYSLPGLRYTKLSDVHPKVTDVLGPDIVLLDNVYGAMISWDRLDPESAPAGFHFVNSFIRTLVRVFGLMLLFIKTIHTLGPGRLNPADDKQLMFVYGLVFKIWGIALLTTVLPIIQLNHSISAAGVKPSGRLIGIEGRVDANTIEKYLWGFSHGRLQVMEPQRYSDIPGQDQATTGVAGDYAFTIVDTRLMTVTHVVSDEPPIAVLVLRKRDGLYGQFLCSYDPRQQAFHRQSVFRADLRGREYLAKHSRVPLSLGLSVATSQNLRPEVNRQVSNHLNDASVVCNALWVPSKWPASIFIYLFFVFSLPTQNLLFQDHRGAGLELTSLFHVVFFLLAQPIAYYLLIEFSLFRCWFNIALVKGLYYIHVMDAYSYHGFLPIMCAAATGLIRGLELPVGVSIAWSWFTLKELPLVLLLLTLTGSKSLSPTWEAPLPEWYKSLTLIIGVFLCLLPSYVHARLIGSPSEVNWLSTKERTIYIGKSTATLLQRTRENTQRLLTKYLAVFSFSVITTFDASRNIVPAESMDWLGSLALTLFIGTIVRKCPKASSFAIICVCSILSSILLSAVLQYELNTAFALRILINMQESAVPLIWTFAVHHSSTIPEVLDDLLASLAGISIAYLLGFIWKMTLSSIESIILIVIKVMVLGLLYVVS